MFDFPEDYRTTLVCVICGAQLENHPVQSTGDYVTASCLNCGKYKISRSSYLTLVRSWRSDPDRIQYFPLLSHQVRQRQRSDSIPFIRSSWLDELVASNPVYPSAVEQIENLVIFLAETLKPGESRDIAAINCQAIAGSFSKGACCWVIKEALEGDWIEGEPLLTIEGGNYEIRDCTLTLKGWEWYEDVGRHRRSKLVFMAMPYGQPELDAIVNEYFRPAVAETGFRLFRLDDEPQAGVIDNRLRVEIRRSRLLVADITHDNHGAIWEAGFAEGLGLPVIYTCEKTKMKGKHFDIRNCQMVPWDSADPAGAAEILKATIRNTLPEEAILTDSSSEQRVSG